MRRGEGAWVERESEREVEKERWPVCQYVWLVTVHLDKLVQTEPVAADGLISADICSVYRSAVRRVDRLSLGVSKYSVHNRSKILHNLVSCMIN